MRICDRLRSCGRIFRPAALREVSFRFVVAQVRVMCFNYLCLSTLSRLLRWLAETIQCCGMLHQRPVSFCHCANDRHLPPLFALVNTPMGLVVIAESFQSVGGLFPAKNNYALSLHIWKKTAPRCMCVRVICVCMTLSDHISRCPCASGEYYLQNCVLVCVRACARARVRLIPLTGMSRFVHVQMTTKFQNFALQQILFRMCHLYWICA